MQKLRSHNKQKSLLNNIWHDYKRHFQNVHIGFQSYVSYKHLYSPKHETVEKISSFHELAESNFFPLSAWTTRKRNVSAQERCCLSLMKNKGSLYT